ncbi:hypothetical protein, partial [Sinorhizobium meliloti]|uniref:hypothetical protein n=1 Tax=Rhizobium meliloti TaxID=382 RepID=UPI001AECB255
DAGYSREEPGAGNPPARICEGEAEWHSYSTMIPRYVEGLPAYTSQSMLRHRDEIRGRRSLFILGPDRGPVKLNVSSDARTTLQSNV